jgi:hypothetical protein
VVVVCAGLYELAPLRMPADEWWTYEVRVFWASHVVRHSSQHYDLYQFWIHTERIGRLPAPVEFVFDTPSQVRYGLTQNIRTFKPHRVAFHEFAAIAATCGRRAAGGSGSGTCSEGRDGHRTAAAAGPAAEEASVVKVLLIPLAIVVFILFLLALGAFGLVVSMAVISFFGQLWRAISGGGRLIGRGERRLGRRGRRPRS